MKCSKCNAEVSNDSFFCTNCGTKLPEDNICVKCGKQIDSNSQFCSYCGASQDIDRKKINKANKKNSLKIKVLFTIPVFCVLIVGGIFFWLNTKEDYSLEGLAKITSEYKIDDFYNGFAGISKDGKMGVINKKGEILTSISYCEGCLSFDKKGNGHKVLMSERLIRLVDSNTKLSGYIDETGDVIIPFIYEQTSNFYNGLASVMKNGKRGYIDKLGNVAIQFNYLEASDFEDGIAVVQNFKDKKFNIINTHGEIVTPLGNYDYVSSFIYDGFAYVQKNGLYGMINKKGEEIIPCEYCYLDIQGGFQNGLILVQKDNFGFVDQKGKEVIPCKFGLAKAFCNGFAYVQDNWNDPEGYYINTAGDGMENKGMLDLVFVDGLALIKKDDKMGFVDNNGSEIIPCVYDDAHCFSENLARVKNGNLWGYIDKKGNKVIPCIFSDAYDFSDNLARVKKGESWGYVDKKGRSTFDY